MRLPTMGLVLGLPLLALAACGPSADRATEEGPGATAASVPRRTTSTNDYGGSERGVVVAVLGDSLAAGLGLAEEEAFPAVLERLLSEAGHGVTVVNAGVSGDTSAGGLSRIDWVLRGRPDLLVLELGANDGLRGMPPAATESNLRRIVARARAAGVPVLLLGMKVPPNYGEDYAAEFEAVFPRLAADLGLAWVPFFLEGVAGIDELNQADGIHPTAEGQRRAAENLLRPVSDLLATLGSAPP